MAWAPPEAEIDERTEPSWQPPEVSAPRVDPLADEPSLNAVEPFGVKDALLLTPKALSTFSGFVDKLFAPGPGINSPRGFVPPEATKAAFLISNTQPLAKLLESVTGKNFTGAERAMEESVSTAVSDATKPESLAALPAFFAPGTAEAYAAGVAAKLPEQYDQIRDAIKEHGLVSPETARIASEAGIQDLMGFLAIKGSHMARSMSAPKTLTEQLSPVIGERPEVASEAPTMPIEAPKPAQPSVESVEALKTPLPTEEFETALAATERPNETIKSVNGSEPAAVSAEAGRILGEGNEQTPLASEPGAIETSVRPEDVAAAPEGLAPKTFVPPEAAEVLSPGPGAASVKEPLADYEPRRFAERFQKDFAIDEKVREETGNRYYEPIPNKITVSEAEQIVSDRGLDDSIRLVRDEAVQMEPRVRSTLAQGLIKKLNQSYSEAVKAGDPKASRFLDNAVDTAEYLGELGTRLGQGVQSFAVWSKLTPEGMLLTAKRASERDGGKLAPEVEAKIKEMSAEIEKAPEGFQKDEKTVDLMSYIADQKGVNPADVPTALWYSNILSGYTTQLVNTIDTGINVLSESAAMAASHPSAVPQILAGLYQGMRKGGIESASALTEGRSRTADKLQQQRILERTQFGKEGGAPIDTSTRIGRFMKAAFESKVAAPLNLWRYPLRAMIASDTLMFNSFREARARVLARALAKKEGLSGDTLFRRVQDVLNDSPEARTIAVKQAESEGLTGLKFKRRVEEIVEQGRPEELVSAADEAAQIATYNHDPSGALGLIAAKISETTSQLPLLKAVVPFTRIVANVTNRGLDYTPWGYKRAFFGDWGGKRFGSEPPTGEAFRTQLVKATLGTTAMATVAALDASDVVQVSASGPDDPNERKQLQNAGWKPYSVKIGDTYYSYQYTPVNIGFAMIGHYRDAVRYNKLNEKDAGTRLAYGMLKSSSTIFDMSFLSGVSDFIETIQGKGASTKGAGRWLTRTVSSVAVPNLVKQVDKLFDPTLYDANTVTEGLIRETPVARSLVLKPMLNALGEPIKPSANRFFTFKTNDPVWKLIVKKQAWIPVPSKTTKIRNRPITPDEYYKLIERSGPKIRQFIQSNRARLDAMTDQQAQEAVREESEKIRKDVKARF